MSTNKRINGNYTITTIGASDTVTITSSAVNITGNLTVSGTQTTVNTTDTSVQDKIMELNAGQTGSAISGDGLSGLTIDRGSSNPARLLYDDTEDKWKIDSGSGSLTELGTGSGSMTEVVDDTSPQLGGSLDVNGQSIVTVSDGHVVVAPNGTGELRLDGAPLRLQNQAAPSADSGYSKLHANTPAEGGSGIFVKNDTIEDELASKSKAILYGIIL